MELLATFCMRRGLTQRVNHGYARWVARVEVSILTASRVDQDGWGPFQGRAQGFSMFRQKSRASPGRAHQVSGPAERWAVSITLLKRCVSLRFSGKDERQQRHAGARRHHDRLLI
eukprot:3864206-Pyramimonas_sp.AAC.1